MTVYDQLLKLAAEKLSGDPVQALNLLASLWLRGNNQPQQSARALDQQSMQELLNFMNNLSSEELADYLIVGYSTLVKEQND